MFSRAFIRPTSRAAHRIAENLPNGPRRKPLQHRHIVAIHDAKARFVKVDRFGVLLSEEVIISRGGEDESSVLIDRGVGLEMKSALMQKIDISLADDPEAIPLKFYHRSLHFAHGIERLTASYAYKVLTVAEILPYPRLIIDKDLAGPEPTDVSAATLWLWPPVSCEITLDNTPDRELPDKIVLNVAELTRYQTNSHWLLGKVTAS